jgi:hypothetical protein
MKKIIFAFLLLLAVTAQAQKKIGKEYYNWHFGKYSAITFNTHNLEPINIDTSSMSTLEGSASISDKNGQLLFYTDGVQVWDRFNQQMPNGFGLRGHYSSTQSAIILKKPGTDYLYYIFTVGFASENRNDNFCYSVVNMYGNSGAGDVIEKNVPIHDRMVAEKQTLIMHRNGKDYWLIAHEAKYDNFVIALITKNGIESVKIQQIGPDYYNMFSDGYVLLGQLKSNIRGDRLAVVSNNSITVELYKFDRKTGYMSDYLPILLLDTNGYYGVEFSPSGQQLYVSQVGLNMVITTIKLIQFDISVYDRNSIEQSLEVLIESELKEHRMGSLQIAPNGKIYFPHFWIAEEAYEFRLGVINKPDLHGTDCNVKMQALALKAGDASYGLPSFCITEPYIKINFVSKDLCEDDDLLITTMIYPDTLLPTYLWRGPAGFTSNKPNIEIKKAQVENSGYYVLEIYENGDLVNIDSIFVKVYKYPEISIIGPKTICPPDDVYLKVDTVESGVEYIWSNGAKGTGIWVKQPGMYSVVAVNSIGCSDTAYFALDLGNLDVEILGILGICENSSTTLKANKSKAIDGRNYTYLWSTGETTESITITETGEYFLQIIREGGCVGYDTVQVENVEPPLINMSHTGIVSICDAMEFVLYETKPNFEYKYIWHDGVVGNARTITAPGKYKLYVTSQYNCIDSAEVEVQMGEKPDVEVEFSNDLNICRGDSVIVTVTFDNENNNIIWEDGNTDVVRTFYESGIYNCVVSDGNGCSDTTEFEIKVFDIEKPEIIADKIYVCEVGTPVTLAANQEYHEYLWSNGATTQSTIIDQAGVYKLHVYNEIGCSDSAEIEIFIMPIEKPEITASKYLICENDTLTLRANGEYASYLWQDGSTNSSIIVRKSGTYKVIVSNEIGCVDSAEIFIDELHISFEFTQSNYDGEIKCTGEESTIVLNLRNSTPYPTIINELILENQIDFRIISPNLPFSLDAAETREIIVAVNSLVPGMFETSIKAISQEPCYFETSTNLSQKFISNISMRLPEINAVAGEQLCIPIFGKINCGASPFVSSATIQISFDAEYFHVNNLKSGARFTKVIANGICTVTIDYTSLNLTETETLIDELCGVALIGRPEKIPLSLSFDDWANDFIEIENLDGSLKLEACAIEVRGIKYFTPTEMTVSPLPANENLKVTIESGSIGTFELILVGFDGSQELLKTWENTQTSSVDLLFDISAKSQGVYSLLLKAPWSIHYQQILILR